MNFNACEGVCVFNQTGSVDMESEQDDSRDSGIGLEFIDHLEYKTTSQVNNLDSLGSSYPDLFRAPIIINKTKTTDTFQLKRPTCRNLLGRFDSLEIQTRPGQKRQSPARNNNTPVLKKRRENCFLDKKTPEPTVPLRRCYSENEEVIKATLERVAANPDLICDGTKECCLPTIPGKHQDLKSITPETLAEVLNHEYDHVVEQCVIVDCRYPYEYEGGHIQGAKNYYTKESIIESLVRNPLQTNNDQKRTILVFHCEFSSERAPKLSRFLRSMDREENKDCYPQLFYPEVYLLHDGYKTFFASQQELCFPQAYMPMHHDDYKEDMLKFRTKSKSWAGEKKCGAVRRRGLCF